MRTKFINYPTAHQLRTCSELEKIILLLFLNKLFHATVQITWIFWTQTLILFPIMHHFTLVFFLWPSVLPVVPLVLCYSPSLKWILPVVALPILGTHISLCPHLRNIDLGHLLTIFQPVGCLIKQFVFLSYCISTDSLTHLMAMKQSLEYKANVMYSRNRKKASVAGKQRGQ